MTVRIGRTICVVLLAMAVAVLPVSAGFATAAPASAPTAVAVVQAIPDCDHHQHHHGAASGKTQKTTDDGACPLACALAGFALAATDVSGIAYSAPASAALKPVRARTTISSLMGSPPFRPPRA